MRRAVVAILAVTAACGPTKYRLASPIPGPSGGAPDRPCVFVVPSEALAPGALTPYACAAWSDRADFDLVDAPWRWFPHLLIGSQGRVGRDCPGCWLEIERPERGAGAVAWRVRLHVPPDDAVVARYEGGYVDGLFEGEGSLSLDRTEACAGFCQDFFAVDGAVADTLRIEGRWDDGFLDAASGVRAAWRLGDGTTYDGDVRHDPARGLVPHGRGVVQAADGARYAGEFVDGRPDGQGERTSADGVRYTGAFRAGVPHGEGVLMLPDGERYEGTFVEGARSGFGRAIYADGGRHEGLWVADLPEGAGVRVDPAGIRWEGTFRAGALEGGRAFVTWPDGARYEGSLDADRPDGLGTARWPWGAAYVGGWEAGRMAGLGRYTWPDGSRWIGPWRDGRPHGCGLHRDAEGDLAATWDRGALVAAGCATSPRPWPADVVSALAEPELGPRALVDALAAHQRTRATRDAVEARAAALAGRYSPVLGEDPADGLRAVHLALAWPTERHQRLVPPTCAAPDRLQVTADGAPVEAAVGGVADADLVVALPVGTTPEVCVAFDGPCGPARGCATVDVPAVTDDAPLEDAGRALPVRLRLDGRVPAAAP
jgi:hypothetical protein